MVFVVVVVVVFVEHFDRSHYEATVSYCAVICVARECGSRVVLVYYCKQAVRLLV